MTTDDHAEQETGPRDNTDARANPEAADDEGRVAEDPVRPVSSDEDIETEDQAHAAIETALRDVDLKERGLAVGVELVDDPDAWRLDASLEELAALAATAGVEIVGTASQKRTRPVPATLIGSGKVEEIRQAARDLEVDVVLFDRELSPRQQRNLEEELDVKVLDRTALILDVFARHARTREGMLQVELAQNEYRLPRLTRMWTHLARQAGGRAGGQGGGVGLRGPGETQIEIDRRLIGRRIAQLNEEIDKLRTQRRQSRKRRTQSGLAVVALVGYTNAGKSTLLNRLSGTRVYSADQLFATLDPTTRRIELPSGRQALLTDTVGFIQKLPTELVAAFRATLEEIGESDLLLHVVDVTHPDVVQQAETVERVLQDLGLSERPMVVAANKVDLIEGVGGADGTPGRLEQDPGVAALHDAYPDAVPVSAVTGYGIADLLHAIDHELQRQLVPIEAVIPFDEGEVVHRVHEHGIVDQEEYDERGTHITARVPSYILHTLEAYRVDGDARR